MAIITAPYGSVYHFTTNGSTGVNISQTSGTSQIFPMSFYNNVNYSNVIDITYEPETLVEQNGPLFVNAVTYNINEITPTTLPITHSIGDLALWSGSYNYNGGFGGGALQCEAKYPILIDFTSSVSKTRSEYGIPAGTILHIYHYHRTDANAGLTLTGSFNAGTTHSITTTDKGASITVIRVGETSNPAYSERWQILSLIGNWTAT